jgi:1-acyl-sn-glycerol-3-phosphate acyltransferase
VTLLLAVFTIGIGLGSLLCERLSAGHVEIGLVPFGSIGLTLFGIDLAFASPALLPAGAPLPLTSLLALHETWRVLFDLFALGLFGGFFIVPLYALIQLRSAPEQRARIIAANNILNSLFMVVGSLAAAGLLADGLSIPALFGVAAVCNAAVAVYIYSLVPEFLLRFIAWLLIHSVYRLRQNGLENIPEEGAAVLVCNHVSFVDPLVIAAASRRPIRFVMDYRIHRTPLISFVFRHMHAIPIAPAKDDAAMMEAAFEEVAKALEAGELVAIFPEGRITDTGEIYPFRPGVQRIVKRTPVPVIPMALQGLWGSFFSRKDGPAMSKPLRRGLFSAIALTVGLPVVPAAATPEHLQAIVAGMRGDWK